MTTEISEKIKPAKKSLSGEVDYDKFSGSLSQRLSRTLLFNEEKADVYLVASDSGNVRGSKQIPALKSILASASPVFEAMFYGLAQSSVTGPEQETVLNEDITERDLKELVRFIYTDEVDIDTENVFGMLYAAKKYQLSLLVERITQFLETNLEGMLTPECCLTIYSQIKLLSDAELTCSNNSETIDVLNEPGSELTSKKAGLIDTCLEFINRNAKLLCQEPEKFQNLSRDDMCLILSRDTFYVPEIDVFRLIVEWTRNEDENNCENVKCNCHLNSESIKNCNEKSNSDQLLNCVRLSLISMSDLYEIVYKSRLRLPDAAVLKALFDKHHLSESPAARKRVPAHRFIPNVNVASVDYGAKLISGRSNNLDSLLMQSTATWSSESRFAYHRWHPLNPRGITIELNDIYRLNTINVKLLGEAPNYDQKFAFAYRIDVSIDGVEWRRLFDSGNRLLTGWQRHQFGLLKNTSSDNSFASNNTDIFTQSCDNVAVNDDDDIFVRQLRIVGTKCSNDNYFIFLLAAVQCLYLTSH